jgi:hypothetical protein
VNQNLWDIIPYEYELIESIDEEHHSTLLGCNIKQWIKPLVSSSYSYINEKGQCEMALTVMPPLGVEILANSQSFSVDVKHKLRHQTQNCHHFGVSTRLDYFHDNHVDINTFAADILITHLTWQMFYKAFYSILETMKCNGVNMNKFFRNLELIVSDFCMTQQKGIRHAILVFCFENEINSVDIDSLFSGCLFHFGQSSLRMKRNVQDQELFSKFIDSIKRSQSYHELYQHFQNLKQSVKGTTNWCQWWSQEQPLTMLWSSLRQKELNTNNNIESLHSLFQPKATVVQEFRQISLRYFQLYDQLAFILRGNQFRYTKMPRKRREYIRKRKRIMRQIGRIKKSQNHQHDPFKTRHKETKQNQDPSTHIKLNNQKRINDVDHTNENQDERNSESNSSCDEGEDEDYDSKPPSQSKIWGMIQRGDYDLGKRYRVKKNLN